MKRIDTLLQVMKHDHQLLEPANVDQLQRLEQMGMPSDLVYFYSKANGAMLHRTENGGDPLYEGAFWQWCLLPVDEMQSVLESGWSHTNSPLRQKHASWYRLLDVQNSDYLCIDLSIRSGAQFLDTFHETLNDVGYNQIVAKSFTELLEQLVASNEAFWLSGETGYGYV